MSPVVAAWVLALLFILLVLGTGLLARRLVAWRDAQRLALGFQRARYDRRSGVGGRPFDSPGR
jgi:hypothetical protein